MATAQEKAIFAALYAREYDKWQQFAKDFRKPNPFGGGQPSGDEPKMQGGAPWDAWPGVPTVPGGGGASGEQAWIALKSFESASAAAGTLLWWAEAAARFAEAQDPPDTEVRAQMATYAGISETPPE